MRVHSRQTGAALVMAAFFALSFTRLWDAADARVYDQALRIRNRYGTEAPAPRILHITTTDDSLRVYDSPEAYQQVFADVLAAVPLSQLNLNMPETLAAVARGAPLAQSLRAAEQVIVPVTPIAPAVQALSRAQNSAEEVALLQEQLWYPLLINGTALPELGAVIMPPLHMLPPQVQLAVDADYADRDAICRRQPLVYRYQDGCLPTLALAIAARELGMDTRTLVIEPGAALTATLADGSTLRVPLDGDGCAYIPFVRQAAYPRMNFDFFAQAAKDTGIRTTVQELLNGTVPVFGESLSRHPSAYTTPLGDTRAGTGIQVALLHALLTRHFFAPLPFWVRLLVLFCTVALLATALLVEREWLFHVLCALGLLAQAAVHGVLWWRFGFIPWCMAPLALLAATWLAGLLGHRLARR